MHENINSCYRVTTLTFLRRNLLACRQEVINSFRLFRVPKSGLQIIKYFSQRHKLQRLEAGLYGLACFKIFHDTLKSVLVSFNCQMCLLSSVLCFLLGVEKEALWFANLISLQISFKTYINEAMGQLDDLEVYMLLDSDPTWDMVDKIIEKIRESWEKGNIDDKTKDYLMVSEDVKPGRFYLLPKIHKQGCPGRPVISGCGTPTEKISAFVDQKAQPLVAEIKSYIKDTNDFLHKLGQIGELPEGAILCTIDVVGLYPHIPHNEGLEALKEALRNLEGQVESEQQGSFNEDILSFAELVLKSNN